MKLIVIIFLLLSISCMAQEKTALADTNKELDYLADLKKELVLVWPKNKTINIVFHGHSVPSGYFRTPLVNTLAAYPHLFLEYIKTTYISAVVNCITTSIGGEQSEQGAKRFKDDVLCMKPDLLFIDYALNDRSIGLERTEIAWRKMIEEALEAELKLVLMTPTPDLKEDILDENAPLVAHEKMIQKLGEEYKIPVINVYRQFKKMKQSGTDISKYMSQNNHPNELGHQVVLEEIVKELFDEL